VRFATLVLMLAMTPILGCRTVWVHPEATQEKYTQDFYRCRFGADPPTAEEIRAGDQPPLTKRRDWEECMALLGWTSRVGMRWSEPYSL
jgi:hypothetical protein